MACCLINKFLKEVAVLPSFFLLETAAVDIVFIVFIFFIWISYFQIHTTVALRRLVSLASCVSLKVRFEEIVKAICQGG